MWLARAKGMAIGITKQDARENRLLDRCSRIEGLRMAEEKIMDAEASGPGTTWFASAEDARRQQNDYPRILAGEAIIVAPLAKELFEPEVIIVYGNTVQIMLFMYGMRKVKYERFEGFFIGEGACSNSLAQCYVTGRASFTTPRYGERKFGHVEDDEMVIAIPPQDLARAIAGLEQLCAIELNYPVQVHGREMDMSSILLARYSATLSDALKGGKIN
jgi:uncharacterized protein (DUF169 family)